MEVSQQQKQEREEIMILSLSIIGFVSLGGDEGRLKMDAVKCILDYLKNIGLRGKERVVDMQIIFDVACTASKTVLLHVKCGTGHPKSFYYKEDAEGVPVIALQKNAPGLIPGYFFDLVTGAV